VDLQLSPQRKEREDEDENEKKELVSHPLAPWLWLSNQRVVIRSST
jgi:hypothetical protein